MTASNFFNSIIFVATILKLFAYSNIDSFDFCISCINFLYNEWMLSVDG